MTGQDRPTVHEVAELVRRLRRLSELGPDADPAERDAVLAAKRELLARIEEADQ